MRQEKEDGNMSPATTDVSKRRQAKVVDAHWLKAIREQSEELNQ